MVEMIYFTHKKEFKHDRQRYALFDIFGDFGGLLEIFYLIGGFITSKYAFHNFLLKAFKKLYLARTK
jgi:hypothetical protein